MGEVNRTMKDKMLAQRAGLPRRVKDMSKEQLELALLKKKECNTRALQIVERLLENTVSEDWFLESLKYISDSHFQDIIEERVILRFCGYPLCHQNLKNIPNQQYRISTKSNKVYDITDRKNYCSNQCYKAGKFIKDQLLSSPLWLRDKEDIPPFKLLPVNFSSIGAGEEVDIGQNTYTLKDEVSQLKNNDHFTSITQFAQESLSVLSKKIDKLEKKDNKEKKHVRFEEKEQIENVVVKETYADSVKEDTSNEVEMVKMQNDANIGMDASIIVDTESVTTTMAALNLTNVSVENTRVKEGKLHVNICENNVLHNEIQSKSQRPAEGSNRKVINESTVTTFVTGSNLTDIKDPVSQTTEKISPVKDKIKSKTEGKAKRSKRRTPEIPPLTSSVIHIEKCLHEWFTLDTMCYLFGEDKVREMVTDKGECIKEYYKAVGSVARDAIMHERYQAICRRLNILEVEESKYDAEVRQLKPLPDYTAVKEVGIKMELKVRAFYQGKTAFETLPSDTLKEKIDEEAPSAILPLVDLHAQNALRRRIVLDRLNRVLPDLLRTFGLSSRDVGTDVRALFCSFSLGAHNITFKPAEWSLLGLVVIKMLSIKDMRLRIVLETEQASKYQTMMLMAFHQDGGYLERLMAWLTDIDNILQKQPLLKGHDRMS